MAQELDPEELRKTVENAGEAWADGEHIDIITPTVVRELIDEVESLRTRFKGMRASRDSERSRADKNAHKLEQAEQAIARVRELADAWKYRGEHDMKHSETLQWPVAEAVHDGGAEMVNNANLIYRALVGDTRG